MIEIFVSNMHYLQNEASEVGARDGQFGMSWLIDQGASKYKLLQATKGRGGGHKKQELKEHMSIV